MSRSVPDSEPSLGEILRRLNEIAKQQERFVERFVTKEQSDIELKLRDQRLDELEKDNDARAGTTRQIVASLIVGFLLVLIPLVGTVQAAIGR